VGPAEAAEAGNEAGGLVRQQTADTVDIDPSKRQPTLLLRSRGGGSKQRRNRDNDTVPVPGGEDAIAKLAISRMRDKSTGADTQPTSGSDYKHRVRRRVVLIAVAIVASGLLSAAVVFGFLVAARGASATSESFLRSQAQKHAVLQADLLAAGIESAMRDGRPSVASIMVNRVRRVDGGPKVEVIRADRSLAFQKGDWSTYQSVASALCDETDFQRRIAESDAPVAAYALRIRSQWLEADGSHLRSLGGAPCKILRTLQSEARGAPLLDVPEDVVQSLSVDDRKNARSWVTTRDGKRSLVHVRPIRATDRCNVCHLPTKEPGESLRAMVVVKTELADVDTLSNEYQKSALLAAAGVALVGVVLLLGTLLIAWRYRGTV
jgi:hypothetical protein